LNIFYSSTSRIPTSFTSLEYLMHRSRPLDFDDHPLLVIWETTRACALACRHCRAAAEDRRHPRELSTTEGFALADQVAAMGTPLWVLTGGDPLQREDLEALIAHGRQRDLRVGVIPAATPRLTRERIASIARAGAEQIAFSLDGEDAESHDAFRQVPGTFQRALAGAGWVREEGVRLQINTVFGAWNADRFQPMADLVQSLGVAFWEVFFLVPTGRGSALSCCNAEQTEHLFAQLRELAERVDFTIKVTEAPHYRRHVLEHQTPGSDRRLIGPRPVNSGRGFCFVDHTGQICPSGFLPLPCGDIRRDGLAEVYRYHPVFRTLRDASQLKGHCGTCAYREACSGGSRARAYALTGDLLAPEPFCAHGALAHAI
jgi:radical SAM protein with 4Fe4S-binding SPASM domain